MKHGTQIQSEFKTAFLDQPGQTFAEYCEMTRVAYPPKWKDPAYRDEADTAFRSTEGRKVRNVLRNAKDEQAIIAVPGEKTGSTAAATRLFPEGSMTPTLWYEALIRSLIPNVIRCVNKAMDAVDRYKAGGGQQSFTYLSGTLRRLADKLDAA